MFVLKLLLNIILLLPLFGIIFELELLWTFVITLDDCDDDDDDDGDDDITELDGFDLD